MPRIIKTKTINSIIVEYLEYCSYKNLRLKTNFLRILNKIYWTLTKDKYIVKKAKTPIGIENTKIIKS